MIKCKNDCPRGKFEGCCHYCQEYETCGVPCTSDPETCNDAIHERTDLEIFQSKAAGVIHKIGILVKQKAGIEAAEKSMREQLQQAMEQYGIKSFDNDVIRITYIDTAARESIDSVKLKAQMPEIAARFTKRSNVKAFVKIELKDGDG